MQRSRVNAPHLSLADSPEAVALQAANAADDRGIEHFRLARWSDAADAWETAQRLYDEVGAEEAAVRVLVRLCVAWRETGRWERARQAGRQALSRAERLDAPHLVAMAHAYLAELALARGELDAAADSLRLANEIAEQHGLRGDEVDRAVRQAELATLRDDPLALGLARHASRLAAEGGRTLQAGRAAAMEAIALARKGRYREVDLVLERAMGPSREVGDALAVAEVRMLSARAMLAAGRVSEALSEANRVAAYAEEVGNARIRTQADALIAQARAAWRAVSEDRKLDRMLDLAVSLARFRDPASLMEAIADAALELLQADRAFVLLVEDGVPRVAARRTADGRDDGRPSMSVVGRTLAERAEVIATDLSERSDLRSAASIGALGLRAVLCVPMLHGRDPLGVIYVDSQTASQQDFADAVRFMRGLAAHAAMSVVNARYFDEARARADRAAEVAHDLRSPSATIAMLAESLVASKDDPVWIEEAAQGIATLARQVMSLAETFLEARDVTWGVVRAASLTREALGPLRFEARERGVVLDVEADTDAAVRGDQDELSRALANVVLNAIRYTRTGTRVTVHVTANDDEVRWSVRDSGPGLPPGDVERLFERGARGDDAKPGYGLGLAIARRVMDLHGGTVRAANLVGGGAEFVLTLPRVVG